MSALLTTTMPYMKVVIDTLKREEACATTTSCWSAARRSTRSSARRSAPTPIAATPAVAVETAKTLIAARRAARRARLSRSARRWARLVRKLVIACGALAREIAALRAANGWPHSTSTACRPSCTTGRNGSPAAVREQIRANRARYATIFVAYGDCGTRRHCSTRVLEEERVERIAGAHCYEFFAGQRLFARWPTRSPEPST